MVKLLIILGVLGIIILRINMIRRHRHTLRLLQLTTAEIMANDTLSQSLSRVETRIGQLFNGKSVFIFWEIDVTAFDWKKGYYHFTLEEKVLDRTQPARITIDNTYGEPKPFYHYPIVLEDHYYGCMLIPLRRMQWVSKLTRWFLKQISLQLIDQFQQLQAKSVIEMYVQQELQKKVAQDMHDGLAQKLFFLSAQLFSIKNELRPRISEVELARIKKLAQHVDESLAEVRNYMLHLRESTWKEGDVFREIEHMLQTKSMNTGLSINLHTAGQAINESYEVLKAIYHLIDESTTNVIKHAQATKIDVKLEVTPIQWSIKIKDDGVGINASQRNRKNDRLGLVGIEERIQQVGGFVSIRSDDGLGTELISVIPRIHNRERGSIIGT